MLHRLQIEPLVKAALLEDLGRAGDITSLAVIADTLCAKAALVARQPGTIAGLAFAALAFELIDPRLRVTIHIPDAASVTAGETIATIEGHAQPLLTAERVALNFLGHLSGIATVTAGIARAIAHTSAHITCTRKTTPNLRAAEKYAVRCGGGYNHRFGLDDAILIKDNHIALAGGIENALRLAKRQAGHLVKIEIEVDTLAQLEEVLRHGADAILLDNMPPAMLREAVAIVSGRAITEASGRITPDTAAAIAETGVDLLSAGWLTHSAPVLDIGLDVEVV